MRYSDVTSREAIQKAVEECDQLGEEAFRRKYGYDPARIYYLVIDGKHYPSKAILGVAHGYQFPDQGPLKPSEFSGGKATVQRKLEELGFEVYVTDEQNNLSFTPFVKIKEYRRSELHDLYGGQQQGGISTPVKFPFIMIYTGETGEQYGYHDEWTDEGVFLYTGEGQVGDMEFVRGNKAIQEHIDKGEDLYLFKYIDRGFVRYLGQFIYSGYQLLDGPDRVGNSRIIIRFELLPIESIVENEFDEDYQKLLAEYSLEMLRNKALASSDASPTTSERKTTTHKRSTAIKAYALARAEGVCEGCANAAPFITKSGIPYLEVHHIRRLSDGGPDHPKWVIACCPNCHRKAHYSNVADTFNKHLSKITLENEARLRGDH